MAPFLLWNCLDANNWLFLAEAICGVTVWILEHWDQLRKLMCRYMMDLPHAHKPFEPLELFVTLLSLSTDNRCMDFVLWQSSHEYEVCFNELYCNHANWTDVSVITYFGALLLSNTNSSNTDSILLDYMYTINLKLNLLLAYKSHWNGISQCVHQCIPANILSQPEKVCPCVIMHIQLLHFKGINNLYPSLIVIFRLIVSAEYTFSEWYCTFIRLVWTKS